MMRMWWRRGPMKLISIQLLTIWVSRRWLRRLEKRTHILCQKDLGVDYRFWNVFHSNFYTLVIFNNKKSKIVKMQYVDWEELREKNDPNFNQAIQACERFGLTDIMVFRYDWNIEVLP
jgi:hypothetical protein